MRYFRPISEGLNFFDDDFDNMFLPILPKKTEINTIMKTDVKEKGDKYILDIDMPGFEKENISISLDSGYLTICGTTKQEKDEENKSEYIRKERFVGTCSRKYYVGDMQETDIDAQFKNGVLTISIPKEAKKPDKKAITIK